MTNHPLFEFTLGVMGLSLIAGYFFWAKARYCMLSLDFLQFKTELAVYARKANCSDDPALVQFMGTLNGLIESPRMISWSWFLAIWLCEYEGTPQVPAQTHCLGKMIERTRLQVSHRIVRHLLKETLPGWALGSLLFGSIRAKATRKAEQPVSRAICGGGMGFFGNRFHAAARG